MDKDANIYLTYQNDGKDLNCLIRWKPDGTGAEFMTGGNSTLCSGTPHGLKVKTEGDTEYVGRTEEERCAWSSLAGSSSVRARARACVCVFVSPSLPLSPFLFFSLCGVCVSVCVSVCPCMCACKPKYMNVFVLY